MYLQDAATLNGRYAERARARRPPWLYALAFVCAHVPLALLVRQSSMVATAHALAVLSIGLGLALVGRRPMQVAYVGAYVVGAEVLWRMSDASIPWEFGKYALAPLFLAALLRAPRLRAPALPLAYFALLLPSAALTFAQLAPADAEQQISFNLSGPFALAVAACFFAHLRLDDAQLKRLFIALLAPLTGLAAVTLYATLTAANLSFRGEANDVTSGGFGPNQVSAVLGLGALLAFWFVLDERVHLKQKALLFGLMILFAVESALTFSRGGLYNACGAAAVAAFYLARDTRARARLLLLCALLVFVGYYLILPGLEAFTGGALAERFQDTSLTGRDVLILADLQIWAQHPLVGVGPGIAALLHEAYFREAAAHTEYSRLLAEHGLLGLAAMVLLGLLAIRNVRRARTKRGQAAVAMLATWSFLFMTNVAMRVAAPSFLLGLTCAALLPDEPAAPQQERAGDDAARY